MILRLQFASFNHAARGIINLARVRAMTDANTLILLPLSGAQPTWRDLLLASSRSKMTKSRRSMFGRIFGLDGRESYRELRLEPLCCPHV